MSLFIVVRNGMLEPIPADMHDGINISIPPESPMGTRCSPPPPRLQASRSTSSSARGAASRRTSAGAESSATSAQFESTNYYYWVFTNGKLALGSSHSRARGGAIASIPSRPPRRMTPPAPTDYPTSRAIATFASP